MLLMGVADLFKLMHWPGANIVILASILMKLILGALTIWKILTTDKSKDFLNS